MNLMVIGGVIGLVMGLLLHWAGFSRADALRDALALRRSLGLRSGLYALGCSMALTAFLCWLAVIDVDGIVVLPLSAGTLAGGVLFGVAAGLCGFTPGTAWAGVGGGPALEALCTAAGCGAAALALPFLQAPLAALQAVPPHSDATLFRMTLDEPFLLEGGFLGQGCTGLLLAALAICVPSPRLAQPELPREEAADPDEVIVPETPLLPAAAPEETFVALLPGEEPLVVDTALDDAPEDEGPSDDPEECAGQEDESPEDDKQEPPQEQENENAP